MVKKYFLAPFVCPVCRFDECESLDSLKLHIQRVHEFDGMGNYFFCLLILTFLIGRIKKFNLLYSIIF